MSFAGGDFQLAGAHPSVFIARYSCIPPEGIFADGFRKPSRDFGPANRRWRFEIDAAKQWIADAGDEAAIQRRAMELVTKHWHAIERVAHALMEHGELGADEAAQLADVGQSL